MSSEGRYEGCRRSRRRCGREDAEELCPQLDLRPQSGHVAGNERLNLGVHVEVAVGALRLAEGDVDVEGYGLHEAAAIQRFQSKPIWAGGTSRRS